MVANQDAYLYDLSNVGVDDPYVQAPDTHLYDLSNVTVEVVFQDAVLYDFSDVYDTLTPEPHIWYVIPNYGKEGWQFNVVGYGFGDTQPTYGGIVKLNVVACPIDVWTVVAAQALPHTIDPATDTADPVHQRITVQVPVGGESGVVTVETDGP